MSHVLNNLIAAIEATTGKKARKSNKGYRVACPAHQGKDPNVFVGDGDKKLIIKCHSHQCDPKDIVEAVGLSLADIYYERLTGTALVQYQTQAKYYQVQKELEVELPILLIWLNDTWEGFWPMDEDADPPRIEAALKRVHAATEYFIKAGVRR